MRLRQGGPVSSQSDSDPVPVAPGTGELPSLSRRVDQHFERIKDGHATRGIPPQPGHINLSNNDYLSLAGDPRIVDAQIDALNQARQDVYMSAVYLDEGSDQRRFEHDFAAHLHAEDAVLCQSGWNANDGLIQTLADALTPVYIDIFAHMSLWQGAHSAGAKARPFRHNSPESLEALLRRHGPGIVVVDAVYSIGGDICPLNDFADVCDARGGVLVVDESHSVGVFGPAGEGLVASLGLADRIPFRTLSLSKAFVGRGGMVVGPARVMEFLRYESRPSIFSSAVVPHEIAAFRATLEAIRGDGCRRDRLFAATRRLREGLLALGYGLGDSETQILPLVAGLESQTIILRRALESRDVIGAVFVPPATARNRTLLRLSANAGLSDEQIERVLEVCAEIRDEVSLANWPSSPRRAAAAA